MAVHSQCQPGKPSLHGLGQRMMCSGEAFFHNAKSAWQCFSPTPASSRELLMMSVRLRPDRMPYLWSLLYF